MESKQDKQPDFPVADFTSFFWSLDDDTLIAIIERYPGSLLSMCNSLTLDYQLLEEEMMRGKNRKLD